jgi:hypothetical protein
VRIRCRVDNGLSLLLEGAVDWGLPYNVLHHGSVAGRALLSLGLRAERPTPNCLLLSTTTPESIIRLSAYLARQEMMTLALGTYHWQGRRVVVALRDFEGDETDLPAVLSEPPREDWLTGLPRLEMDLPGQERLAVARWAYVPDSWLSTDLAREMLPTTLARCQ